MSASSTATPGFTLVALYNVEGLLYGQMCLPPFARPPLILLWRELVFLRLPREGLNLPRYREVHGYLVPDQQELIDDE